MNQETVNYLNEQGIIKPEIGLILGSGLGDLVEEFENPIAVPYQDIPDFPVSTVAGHAGQLVYGKLANRQVIALQGRFHYYEGYDLQTVTYPVRVFKELGVEKLIVTNAAGGINPDFNVGDLMIITDHINLSGANPLMGPNIDEHGPRFVDMSDAYSKRAQNILHDISQSQGIPLQEGVYTWFSGPTYETPAEIRFARTIGGDAAGMSTAPETIVAKHCGMEVARLSCITNMAAGMQESLNHEEVVEVTKKANQKFRLVVKELIRQF